MRRLAALGALATIPAMVIVLVAALFGRPSGLVLALVLLALAAGAAWVAVTNRGVLRYVAAAAVVAIVVAIAFVLGSGTGGIVALVLIAALTAAFGAAARYAVGPPARHGKRVEPARRGVLIVNPMSGGGKAERADLAEKAEARGIRTITLTRGLDLRTLAEDAVTEGADVLGMAGGDGSQAIVASVASSHGLPHVTIPAGTRNHFALDLGLDRDDVVGALDAYGEAVEHVIDLATVNDRVFVNNASLGAYAEVVQSDAYRDAKLRTWADMAPEVLKANGGGHLRYRGADDAQHDDAAVILVSNNRYHLTSIAGAGPASTPAPSASSPSVSEARATRPRSPAWRPPGASPPTAGSRSGMRPRSASRPTSRCPSASTARRSCSIPPCASRCSPPPFACASRPTPPAPRPPAKPSGSPARASHASGIWRSGATVPRPSDRRRRPDG